MQIYFPNEGYYAIPGFANQLKLPKLKNQGPRYTGTRPKYQRTPPWYQRTPNREPGTTLGDHRDQGPHVLELEHQQMCGKLVIRIFS